MIEPVLVYKKGEGWVYETHESYTGIIHGYKVTCVKRKALEGEHGFTGHPKTTPEETFKALASPRTYWNEILLRGDVGLFPGPGGNLTVILEKL